MANETSNPNQKVTRNTSTSMKQFHGYTVEFYKNNEVRSCRKGADLKEAKEHLNKFCSKHKKTMSGVDVCIKAWRDSEGRLRYMPSYHFESEADAKEFAKAHKNAIIVNHDDGNQA